MEVPVNWWITVEVHFIDDLTRCPDTCNIAPIEAEHDRTADRTQAK